MTDPHAIVASLALPDKVRLLSGRDFWTTEPVDTRVPPILMTDGPHGLRKQTAATDQASLGASVPATCFPTAVTLASSWDPGLVREVGEALGREARAQGVSLLLGPGLNLKRHPCGGRNFEYFSEDPYLSGTLAAAMVQGIESRGVGACPKHYAANNAETARMVLDTVVDERTLRELYLRGFEIVVDTARPAAIMTAYNLVNGQYASEHEHLVGDILRGEWGYDGLVVSDWGGTNDHVAGLAVGADLEMPGGAGAFDEAIAAAVRAGTLPQANVDTSAARVVDLALRRAPHPEPADDDAHHALARRAAAAGTVLLRNDGLLPLPDDGSLAVIGAFAEQPRYQGAGSSQVNPTRMDSLLAALREEREVAFASGYDPATGDTTPHLLAQAARTARGADRVVLVVGLPPSIESEAIDRADWNLPEGMDHLVEIVLDVNPNTAVVLMNGAPIDVPWADRPAALVEACLGGQAGGSALADVLTGRSEPGGRLAESFPFALSDLPAHANFPGRDRQVQYREALGVGYRCGAAMRFPFGHGLSYTTFAYGPVDADASRVAVEVTNTGDRAGSEVVQVYVGKPDSVVPRPDRELKGFAKVHLEPGQTARATVPLDRLAVWQDGWVVEPGSYEVLVGASSTDIRASALITVDSPDTLSAEPPVDPVSSDEQFERLLARPIPAPPPVRPFTRNSTLADLRSHPIGKVVAAVLVAAIARRVNGSQQQEDDPVRDSFLRGMPLRGFVLLAGGSVSFAWLDRLLAVLNAQPRAALRPNASRTESHGSVGPGD